MLVPIGGWCRTAYQVNEYLKKVGAQTISYPYDWTITPYGGLKKTLSKDFSPESVLSRDSLVPSEHGSIVDINTELIHHHDFSPIVMKSIGSLGGVNKNGVPLSLFETDLIAKAKQRFVHTYKNLDRLKQINRKLAFIRWDHPGSPIVSKEVVMSLADAISNYLGNENFSVLQVRSEITEGELSENDVVLSYNYEDFGVSAIIAERKGFNGDGTKNFRGDTVSWDKLLGRFVAEEGVDLSNSILS